MNKKILLASVLGLFMFFGFFMGNTAEAQTLPPGCVSTSGFSITTGQPCSVSTTNTTAFPAGCSSALGYSITTGRPCSGTNTAITLVPGCTTALGYSLTTGAPCSGSSSVLSFLAGCTSINGYSIITGRPCNGTNIASVAGVPGFPRTAAGVDALKNNMLLLWSGVLVALSGGYIAYRSLKKDRMV